MKIYLSGPITGKASYAASFRELASSCRRKFGGDVTLLDPTRHPTGLRPAEYMRLAFADIDAADAVAFCRDWKESDGAQLEYRYARYTGKTTLQYWTWEETDDDTEAETAGD